MSLSTNLISYWKLDGNSNDAVGSNNGTDTDITYSAGNGKIVQGAGFNGTTSKIIGSNINIAANSTISCWVKTSQNSAFYPTIYGLSSASTNRLIFYDSPTGVSATIVDSGNQIYVTSLSNICDGNWHFLVATVTNTSGTNYTIEFFIDNVSQGTMSASLPGNFNAAGMIMGVRADSANYYLGSVDECAYWSRALTSTEVSQLWNGGAGLAYPFPTIYTMVTSPVSFTYTTQSSEDPVKRFMITAKATYILTGVASGFQTIRKMITASASYVLTGMSAGFQRIINIVTAPTTFILTGMSVFISKSGIIKPIIELVNIIKPKLNSSINKIKITIVNSLKPKLK